MNCPFEYFDNMIQSFISPFGPLIFLAMVIFIGAHFHHKAILTVSLSSITIDFCYGVLTLQLEILAISIQNINDWVVSLVAQSINNWVVLLAISVPKINKKSHFSGCIKLKIKCFPLSSPLASCLMLCKIQA